MTDKDLQERPWKPGLPPGKASPEMVARYEVRFTPGGKKWHREKAAQ